MKFVPQPSNQIICKYPRELYVCDITEIPKDMINNSNSKEKDLLSIVDHFSKFSGNYILENKNAKNVQNNINDFIVKNGKPYRILIDNGGEFNNKDFKKYCKKKGIELTMVNQDTLRHRVL